MEKDKELKIPQHEFDLILRIERLRAENKLLKIILEQKLDIKFTPKLDMQQI